MNKACFLDRDGVIIHEKCYLHKPEEVEIYQEAFDAISLLKKNGYKVIVITNQAGVARGYYLEEDIIKVHDEIDRQLDCRNLSIDAYYYCPHHPNGSIEKYSYDCDCRKPEPKMILQAAKDLNIDLNKSFMIGDKISDVEAAHNAGIVGVLVKTGHGMEYIKKAASEGIVIFKNIAEAVKSLLSQENFK